MKKRILSHPLSEIKTIEILNLNLPQALVTMEGETETVIADESLIGFANSQVVSTSQSMKLVGIVCWVATEVRALSSGMGESGEENKLYCILIFFIVGITVELHRNSPFAEYSSKGFLLSIIAMITFATINAIVAYYYYETEQSEHAHVCPPPPPLI